MQTSFTPEQLADPDTAVAEGVIRKCVHCGFCTATCPTYVLLGDERDSPRGRIYLIKDMLENEREPTAEVVTHIDRCLSCLSCMTTCPSGVNYSHLIDHARAYIERRYVRPWPERALRALLAAVLSHRGRFRAALRLARIARPLRGLIAAPSLASLRAMLDLAPSAGPPPRSVTPPAAAELKGQVILLRGCVEPELAPQVQAAARRLLARLGYRALDIQGEGCCGALVHHMGREQAGREAARRNIDAWSPAIERGEVSAILVTASGCGSVVKDYGFMLREDPAYAQRAERVSAMALDITEFLDQVGLPPSLPGWRPRVAYHPACSLQHGQKVTQAPLRLLQVTGFEARLPADAHLCCGSAGVYNILQPVIAGQLGALKAASLDALDCDVIAAGNVGCATQIAARAGRPVVHTVELLDWATGGPAPVSSFALEAQA